MISKEAEEVATTSQNGNSPLVLILFNPKVIELLILQTFENMHSYVPYFSEFNLLCGYILAVILPTWDSL